MTGIYKLSDFDFALPDERIALEPASPRDSAKLLRVKNDQPLQDHTIPYLLELVQPNDVVVFNKTKVIPAQISGIRYRGEHKARIQATLLRNLGDGRWKALIRPAKKILEKEVIYFGEDDVIEARLEQKNNRGEVLLHFERTGHLFDIWLAKNGTMPLPPYIASKRKVSDIDNERYQTVYAEVDGAVAAPTAGLHFTPELLALIEQKAQRVDVTLHVGAGTFLPVQVDNIKDHKMHAEWGIISQNVADRLNQCRKQGGRIISIGTTSLRLLETSIDQNGVFQAFEGDTDIFITPDQTVHSADILMTNFHLPKSTLFMLVSAFSGMQRMQEAYRHAIDHQYRFYSYGDACLLYNQAKA